jgi:fucose permease
MAPALGDTTMSRANGLRGSGAGRTSFIRDGVNRARIGIAVIFFLTGAVSASLAARTPAIKQQLDLTDGQLAITFLGLEIGAIAGLPLGAAIVPRVGSRMVLAVAFPIYAAALVIPAVTPSLPTLTAAFIILACANAIVDVAMNAHGVVVERHGDRPMLSGFHAWHSLGGLAGAAGGAVAAHFDIALLAHFVVVATAGSSLGAGAARLLLPSAVDVSPATQEAGQTARERVRTLLDGVRHWSRPVVVLGGLAFAVILAMASANNWSAVYIHDSLGASSALAAVGFGAYSATMTLGRLVGDRLTARFGAVRVFRAGTLLASVGFGGGLLIGVPAAGIMGFAMLGAGLSIAFPLILSSAGNLETEATASVVARVSAVGYFGSFVSPVVIGVLAGLIGLREALALPVLLCACAALGARFLAPPADQR